MGRGAQGGGAAAATGVPVPRWQAPVPLSKLHAPGTGFQHGSLTGGPGYAMLSLKQLALGKGGPKAVGGGGGSSGGAAAPAARGQSRVGNRRVGRANVGASNRRVVDMAGKILNATGKQALNTSAIIDRASTHSPLKLNHSISHSMTDPNPRPKQEKRAAAADGPSGGDDPPAPARPPPRADVGNGLTNALRAAAAQIERNELAGVLSGSRYAQPAMMGEARNVQLGAVGDQGALSDRGRLVTHPAPKVIGHGQARAQDTAGGSHNAGAKQACVPQERCASVPLLENLPKLQLPPGAIAPLKTKAAAQGVAKGGPDDVNDGRYRFKYDRVMMMPLRDGRRGGAPPYQMRFQAISRHDPKTGKAPNKAKAVDPRKKAVEIMTKLADLVAAKKDVRKTFRNIDEDKSGSIDYNEFRRFLQLLHFDVDDNEFTALMRIVDKDESGEVDYDEFTGKLGNTLDWEVSSQGTIETERSMESEGTKDTDNLDKPWEAFVDTRPAARSSLDGAPEQGEGPKRIKATQFKGHEKVVTVGRSLSTGDLDPRWRVPRTADARDSTVYRVPNMNVKYTTSIDLGDLEQKLKSRHPTISEAFTDLDRDRSGTVSRKELQSTLYGLNISLSTSQVERIFAAFDDNNSGSISYVEFMSEIARTEEVNNVVYGDMMNSAQGKPPIRVSLARQLLPKTDVSPLVSHPAPPKMWYSWNSPCAATTIRSHMRSIDPSEGASPWQITKDGIQPGSNLDFYETGQRWMGRHQRATKALKAERLKEQGARTAYNIQHCADSYAAEKRKNDEKAARRVAAVHMQQQRYHAAMRRADIFNNPHMSKYVGYDMTSDAHDKHIRKSARTGVRDSSTHLYERMLAKDGHTSPYPVGRSSHHVRKSMAITSAHGRRSRTAQAYANTGVTA